MSYQCPTCGGWRSCWSPDIFKMPDVPMPPTPAPAAKAAPDAPLGEAMDDDLSQPDAMRPMGPTIADNGSAAPDAPREVAPEPFGPDFIATCPKQHPDFHVSCAWPSECPSKGCPFRPFDSKVYRELRAAGCIDKNATEATERIADAAYAHYKVMKP